MYPNIRQNLMVLHEQMYIYMWHGCLCLIATRTKVKLLLRQHWHYNVVSFQVCGCGIVLRIGIPC
nr:MAG TPA: hypothetical protein [Caudoviricetes sp.]